MMAGIDTNLDDLQSGIEACSRAAHTIQSDAAAVDQQVSKHVEHADLIRLLVRRAKQLQACAFDQSGALRELRQNFALLRAELKLPNTAQRRGGTRDRRRNGDAGASSFAERGIEHQPLVCHCGEVRIHRMRVNYFLPRRYASQLSLTVPTSMPG
jgi:hypothetical protein